MHELWQLIPTIREIFMEDSFYVLNCLFNKFCLQRITIYMFAGNLEVETSSPFQKSKTTFLIGNSK